MEVAKELASGNLKFYPNSSLLGRKASPRTMQLLKQDVPESQAMYKQLSAWRLILSIKPSTQTENFDLS